MKTTLVSKENNEAKFTLDFTAEEFENAVTEVYKRNRNRFSVNGFRKGKAPRSIIEKKYGEGIFFEDAVNDLFGKNYLQAVDELDLEVIDSPKADFSEIGKGKPLTVTLDVKLFPIVEVKDYKGVEVEQLKTEVTDEEVDESIENLRKRNARMVVVERPVEKDDTVMLDYAGFVGDEQFEGGTAENQELKIGSGKFIPGFEEQLVGAVAGEERDVKVTFPDDYAEKSLAGKEAVFHCKINEIKEEELPEADDEFAKDVSEFDTLEELKENTKKDIFNLKEDREKNRVKDEVVSMVYELNDIDVPKSLIEEEISQMAQELDQQLKYQGLSLEQYCRFTGKSMQDFRDDVRRDAEKRAGTRIALLSVAAAETVEITEEELDAEFDNMAKQYNMAKDEIKKMLDSSIKLLKKDLLVKKVIDMLYDEAKVKEVDSLTAKEADEAGNGKPAEATEDKGKAGAKKAKKKAGNKGESGTGKDTE